MPLHQRFVRDNGEPDIVEFPLPIAFAQCAAVAGVAQRLESIEVICGSFIFGRAMVLDEQVSARPQYARRFLKEARWLGEVMECQAAGNEIIAGIREGHFFGIGVLIVGIRHALGAQMGLGRGEHRGGEIAYGDMRNAGREFQGRVSAASGDIERTPIWLRRADGEESFQIFSLRVRVTMHVALCQTAITLLRQTLRIELGVWFRHPAPIRRVI